MPETKSSEESSTVTREPTTSDATSVASDSRKDPDRVKKSFTEPQLVHAAVLFRHTVRAPRVFPPNDPLLKPELFPSGVERSTPRGLKAAREAALVWREWYKHYLTGDPNEVYARSSQADRCHETMSTVLNTWYPSTDELRLSRVAIRMPTRGHDKYVDHCGKMPLIFKKYVPEYEIPDSIYAEESFRTIGDYVNFLKEQTELWNENLEFFYAAYMEGFLSLDYEGTHTKEDHWMFQYPKTREFARLHLLDMSIDVLAPYFGHFLMNGIADELENAANGSSRFKLSLFSFHDINLLSVLRALGHGNKPTDPLAAIAFELWEDHAGYRVAVRMSEGISKDWEYKPDKYLQVYNGTSEVSTLPELLSLLRSFYASQLDVTNCGYFGSDAKI